MLNLQHGNLTLKNNRQMAIEAFANILKHYYEGIYNEDTFRSNEILCASTNSGFYTVCCENEIVKIYFYAYDKFCGVGIKTVTTDSVIRYLYDRNIHGAIFCDWCVNFDEKITAKDRWWMLIQHENMKNVFDGIKIMAEKYGELINERVDFCNNVIECNEELKTHKVEYEQA